MGAESESCSNPLKIALRVPSREHLAEHFIFLAVMNGSLVAARTEVYPASDWQWTFILNASGTCSSWLSRKLLKNPLPRNWYLSLQWIHILWHDAWTPEVCSQKSTAEVSVARQQLAETYFRGNEYAWINQSVARRLSQVSWKQIIIEDNLLSDWVFCIQSSWS
jgi:hypothetical protein